MLRYIGVFYLALIFCAPSLAKTNRIGYFTSWSNFAEEYSINDIPAHKLTHLIYWVAYPNENGEIVINDPYLDTARINKNDNTDEVFFGNFRELIRLKQQHPHLKTLISLGGWGHSQHFSNIAADEVLRAQFAQNISDFIIKYQFDGVEIDWNFPVFGGLETNSARRADSNNQVLLLKDIRASFDQNKPDAIIATTFNGVFFRGQYQYSKLNEFVDLGIVMSHNYRHNWTSTAGHISPLFGLVVDGKADYPLMDVSLTLRHILKQGFDSKKLIATVPTTAQAWNGINPAFNGLGQAWGSIPSGRQKDVNEVPGGSYSYSFVQNLLKRSPDALHWDDNSKAHYYFDGSMFISFESKQSLTSKLDYFNAKQMGGVAFWEVSADTPSDEVFSTSLIDAAYSYDRPWHSMLDKTLLFFKRYALYINTCITLAIAIIAFSLIRNRKLQYEHNLDLQQSDEIASQQVLNDLVEVKSLSQWQWQHCLKFINQHKNPLSTKTQRSIIEFARHQLFLNQMANQILDNCPIKARNDNANYSIQAITQSLCLEMQIPNQMGHLDQWIRGDWVAHMDLWRFVLAFPISIDVNQQHLAIKISQQDVESISLQPFVEKAKVNAMVDSGYFVLFFDCCQQQNPAKVIQKAPFAPENQDNLRLAHIQDLSKQLLLLTSFEEQLNTTLGFLNNDPQVSQISTEHQEEAHWQLLSHDVQGVSILLETHYPLEDKDLEHFSSMLNLLKMSQDPLRRLAQKPQHLCELHEISSKKDRINYIHAENGYSGIYDQTGKPQYVFMRLKTIKQYFDDQTLLQVHRSWLVNPNKIERIIKISRFKCFVEIENKQIPISRNNLGRLQQRYPQWFEVEQTV